MTGETDAMLTDTTGPDRADTGQAGVIDAPLCMTRVIRGYNGVNVLNGVDLTLEPGTVTGLLGRNGAGKTTLIRCALGLLRPESGASLLFGEHSWDASPAVRARIGFVPQTFDAFLWMQVGQLLDYTGAFYPSWNETLVTRLVDRFALNPASKVARLSEGMRQRVAIVMAMGHEPDLLVLDEPVSSLDPRGRREFLELVLALNAEQGRTVLFSTHITSDIERVAARVAILERGRIALHCDLDALKDRYSRLHIHAPGDVAGLVAQLPQVLDSRIDGQAATVTTAAPEAALAQLRAQPAVRVEAEALNLEEIFLELNP